MADKDYLTAKQKLFVKWYCSAEVACNATEAALRAGYKGNENTLSTVGWENLRKPAVARAIAKHMGKAMAGASVTIDKVLQDLEAARKAALEAEQYGVAVRASELQGKYLKMFVDRIEHSHSLEEVDQAELDRLESELVARRARQAETAVAADGTLH